MSRQRPEMIEEDKNTDENGTPEEWELNEAEEALEFPGVDQTDAGAASAEAGDAPAEELDPLAALQAERDELDDKLKRMMAEYQNFGRRADQNVIAARQYQLMEVAKKLVPVLDHFDSALGMDTEKTSIEDLLKGVTIVRDELMRSLESFGVVRLDVGAGDLFDPNCHEALMRQADTDIEPNHVTAQLQPGYLLNDVTIRPAKVSIAE
jgi:molecular chaperone GrpE